jgi:hypothetical protein
MGGRIPHRGRRGRAAGAGRIRVRVPQAGGRGRARGDQGGAGGRRDGGAGGLWRQRSLGWRVSRGGDAAVGEAGLGRGR